MKRDPGSYYVSGAADFAFLDYPKCYIAEESSAFVVSLLRECLYSTDPFLSLTFRKLSLLSCQTSINTSSVSSSGSVQEVRVVVYLAGLVGVRSYERFDTCKSEYSPAAVKLYDFRFPIDGNETP